MKHFFSKPYRFAIVFTLLLFIASSFVLLDTFVIPKSYQKVAVDAAGNAVVEEDTFTQTGSTNNPASSDQVSAGAADEAEPKSQAVITDTSYRDDKIKINITTERDNDTSVYIAEIEIAEPTYLKTALAKDTYGRNIKAATSTIAESNHAIFAINGDFYGFRDYGYVLRNGILYRDTAGDAEDLIIDNTGYFSTINESDTDLKSLDLTKIWQILSFGPALIKDSNIVVDSSSEVSRSMSSNPRTAIGMISPLHYVIIVSDGRTVESAGLSLLELAKLFADHGCTTAYNLDGGGSSTMYFNGKIINIPTDGRIYGEREVSDIVYIGY